MSKSRDIADSAATINYIDNVTSDVQSQIDTATSDIATNTSDIAANTSDIVTKAPLSNPTFTGTVTATSFSGDGSALTGIDSLPSQTGNNGLFLTTDGTDASWGAAGGAWNYLGAASFTGVAVDLTGFVSSSYSSYAIVFERVTNSTLLTMQVFIGGTLQASADYGFVATNTDATGGDLLRTGINETYIRLTNGGPNDSYGIIYIKSANAGGKPNFQYQVCNGTTVMTNFSGAGFYNSASAITGIRFTPLGGSASFTSGIARVYGISNS